MIIGIGTDIIEIARVEGAIQSQRFINKVYTPFEIQLLEKKRVQSWAGFFAAKEAVAKALGTGFSPFWFTDIEIQNDSAGKPYATLRGGAKELSEALGIKQLHITISHSRQYAVAFALAEG